MWIKHLKGTEKDEENRDGETADGQIRSDYCFYSLPETNRCIRRGEEQLLPASEAAENRLHRVKKKEFAKNTTSSSSSHPPSLHPFHQHTHTHHLFLSAYINITSTHASWTQGGSSGVGGEWVVRSPQSVQSSMRRARHWRLSLHVCVCVIRGSISPTILRIYSLTLHPLLLSSSVFTLRNYTAAPSHTHTLTYVYCIYRCALPLEGREQFLFITRCEDTQVQVKTTLIW